MENYNDMVSFANDFGTSEQCLTYLCEMKWKGGYECRKCKHKVSVYGRTWYYRKCQKCQYDESCTAHTLFHKLKFDVVKAFWIVYQLSTMKKGMSTMEIARQYNLHQQTAWYFKRKVQLAMHSSSTPLLEGFVQIDETSIGGYEKEKPGRSHGKKKMVQVAMELVVKKGDVQVQSARAKVIDDFSAKEMGTAIDKMVSQTATVHSDGWSSYPKAVGDRVHFADNSDGGANFPQLHRYIFNLKNWLRGIHHKVSLEHLQSYLDEFNYRFNRRNQIPSCPIRLLNYFVKLPWYPYRQAVAN